MEREAKNIMLGFITPTFDGCITIKVTDAWDPKWKAHILERMKKDNDKRTLQPPNVIALRTKNER